MNSPSVSLTIKVHWNVLPCKTKKKGDLSFKACKNNFILYGALCSDIIEARCTRVGKVLWSVCKLL